MNPRRSSLAVLLFCAGILAPALPACAAGSGLDFVHEQAGRRVPVRCYVPVGAGPTAPVVFVMHGLGRNPADCLADWAPAADQHSFVLVVPEFARSEFPGVEGYNLGNTVDRAGQPLPRDQWAFSVIEPIFDAVRQRTGNRSESYLLYGFSAGAQFVQRFVFFVPEARVARAVAASAGWYTLPDLAVAFPYGLKDTPVGEAGLRAALQRSVVVLLGDADTDVDSKLPRRTPEAEAQGPHRLARGQFFYRAAMAAAVARQIPCRWTLSIAPHVGHSEKAMLPYAVRCLLPDSPSRQP